MIKLERYLEPASVRRAMPEGVFQLVTETAARYKLLPSAILAHCNSPLLVKARTEVWLRLREEGWSYPQIGKLWLMHHSTVHHQCQKAGAQTKARAPHVTEGPHDYSEPDESGIWAI